jgi:DNA invertase Pin-like site-specific DNA recombinase
VNRTITKTIFPPAPLPSLTRVAAYARVSTGKDEMLHSLAAQVSYYSEYIQKQSGWIYSGVYADEAITGTKDNRPEFQRLLIDCRNKQIDLVLTKSISRFARNTVTLLETVRELKSLGVDVYFEEQNIHTLSGEGELMLTILASYAQEESLSVSKNCKWRIRQDFNKGKPGNIKVFGYDLVNGQLEINTQEAETVRTIYFDYLSGLGKNAIVKKLRDQGIPTKTNRNWQVNTIHTILRDEKYTGQLIMQKTFRSDHLNKIKKVNNGELLQYCIDDAHPAIIPTHIFEKVQQEIARREKKYMPQPRTPIFSEFTGKIQCGICGASFRRKIVNAGTRFATAKWVCSSYNTHGISACSMKPIPEDVLKRLASEVLGMGAYDPNIVTAKFLKIIIPKFGKVEFHTMVGRIEVKTWRYPSRSDSWTDDMKRAARNRTAIHRGGN